MVEESRELELMLYKVCGEVTAEKAHGWFTAAGYV
jgi:hypothetical protein